MAKKKSKQKGARRVTSTFTQKDGTKVVNYSDGFKTKNGVVARGATLRPDQKQVKLADGTIRTIKKGSGADTKYAAAGATTVSDTVGTPMISSDMGKDLVRTADETIKNLSPISSVPESPVSEKPTTPTTTSTPATTPESAGQTTSNDYITYVNESTGQESTLRGDAITDANKSALESQGYTLASSDTSKVQESPEITKAKQELASASAEVDSYMTRLESSLITDQELASEVKQIRSKYSARAKEMQDINMRREQAMKTLGVRLGGRYTGGTGGIMGSILSEEERQGLMRIEEIENDKQDAILQAKKAARDHNFQLYTKLAADAQKKQEEKAEELKTLKEAQAKQDEKIAEEKKQMEYDALIIEQLSAGVTDPLELYQNLGGQVPFDSVIEVTKLLPENKPVTLGKSDILVDPKTGKVIARGIGESTGGGSVQVSAEAQAWADLINQGKAKIDNVPATLRSAVVSALAGGGETMSKANEMAVNQANTALESINSALNRLTGKTGGSFGTAASSASRALSFIPGTEARDVVNDIETVQALIGFDALAEMRAASPTGGALGSITERELRFLQSVQGSLDPLQSTETLIRNLNKIKKSFERVRAINSVDTTPEEYKKQFPDATKEELNEIRQRRGFVDYTFVSNTELLGFDEDSSQDPNGIYQKP